MIVAFPRCQISESSLFSSPNNNTLHLVRQIHTGKSRFSNERKEVAKQTLFDSASDKTKDNYLAAVKQFYARDVHRRGHVEFIYTALKKMEEFGVHRDLQAYKEIVDVFPKGKFIPRNMFQSEFMHYPKQQQCAVDLLEQMENNGVVPDVEMGIMLRNIFGKTGFPCRKLARMLYWMPKFKNLSPWAFPDKLPNSSLELAKLAIQRICSADPATDIDVYETKELSDSLDDTWIVSGQSETQRELIQNLPQDQTIFVEGAFRLWLRKTSINYFILRAEMPRPRLKSWNGSRTGTLTLRSWIAGEEPTAVIERPKEPSIHEQEDGIILGTVVTGSSSKDSLLSWIRFLERKNPRLGSLPVLFSTQSPIGEVIPALEGSTQQQQQISQLTAGDSESASKGA
nr:EOG090X07J4 [Eulimnadia texana]